MQELNINQIKVLTVPAGAFKLTITHELGDIVVSNISVTGTYNFTSNSIGVHKFEWLNNSNVIIKTDFYDLINPILSSADFFADYDQFSAQDDQFTKLERRVRKSIETYCSQKFGPYINKTVVVEGNDTNGMLLPYPILKFINITDSFGNDLSTLLQINPNNNWFVDRQSINYGYTEARLNGTLYDTEVKTDITRDNRTIFRSTVNYLVQGDFGWYYIPIDVSEAAKLLIADLYAHNDSLRALGYKEAQLGDFKYVLGSVEGTGNSYADQLLAPYVIINIGMV